MSQSQQSALPVVLAAGLGTRMKSSKPKVLHELCGRPMLSYVLDAAEDAGHRRPLVVYSPPTAAITEVFADRADFALQETPLGTADAVRAALAVAPADVAEVLVLSGDVPLVDPDLLAELVDLRRARGAVMALISVHALDPEGLGRVIRSYDGGQVLRIVEQKDASPEDLSVDEINAGIYAFDAAWLRGRIGDVSRRRSRASSTCRRWSSWRARIAGRSFLSLSRTTAPSAASTTGRSWPRPSSSFGWPSTKAT